MRATRPAVGNATPPHQPAGRAERRYGPEMANRPESGGSRSPFRSTVYWQFGNLKLVTYVLQLKVPEAPRYSLV